ncbi:MAG: hypothetical protein LBP53_03175 [Candidatus Peribacteria bacterium]|jgi:hypothetical protein|nr:hypothetical protein [Candidatus Peribacteria bacterium]
MGDMGGVQGIEDMLGDSDFEKKDGKNSMGVVPFILNNRYANIGAMLKEKAFFYEIL